MGKYTDIDSRSRAVRQLLADKRMLMILDNVQASQDVKPLLPPTTGSCRVLITTRRHDLSVTYGAFRIQLGSFAAESRDALQLFATILGTEYVQRVSIHMAMAADILRISRAHDVFAESSPN